MNMKTFRGAQNVPLFLLLVNSYIVLLLILFSTQYLCMGLIFNTFALSEINNA